MKRDTVSVLVIALNEETHIGPTTQEVRRAAEAEFEDYELILIDDGSTDGTGHVAEELARNVPKIKVLHNGTNRGLGWSYKAGLAQARMQYITWVCGKHDIEAAELRRIFAARHSAELVVPFHANPKVRSLFRCLTSRLYVGLLNTLFGFNLGHYNESVLLPTTLARRFFIRTDSYAFQAELLIKALKSGHTYVQVPIRIRPTPGRTSKTFRLQNILGVARFFVTVLWDVYGTGNYRVQPSEAT
ncbi:MAG: glycosyltransferase family 2 protein [Kiritimatiellia bacterium]